ncbi:MAG TPA: Hpt domain-containing protein [Pseudobacteroides sp.]|nr:Hpt domain-containing protein [Pseudobacteroides sp.]
MNAMLEGYIEDLKDNLTGLSNALMVVKLGSIDADIIDTIFNAVHTIKDNSTAMEFEQIEKVMHIIEDILIELRNGTMELSSNISNILFACHDFLKVCLDEIEENKSDINVDISSILDLCSEININKIESNKFLHPSQIIADDINKMLYTNIDPETLHIISDNMERGFSPYSLEIDFADDCIMKSVHAWLIFQKIAAFSILIYSNPPRPDDKSFKDGSFSMEGSTIQFLLLTEKDINELIAELEKLSDIASIRSYYIHPEEINTILERHKMKENILKSITDIGIQLADMETTSNQNLINDIVDLLDTISNLSLAESKNYIIPASKQIAEILREKAQLRQNIDMRSMEVITQVFYVIEAVLKTPDNNQSNDQFREKILNIFIDELKANNNYSTQKIRNILQPKGILKENELRAKINMLLEMLNELVSLNSQLKQQIETVCADKTELINALSKESNLIKKIQSLSASFRIKSDAI